MNKLLLYICIITTLAIVSSCKKAPPPPPKKIHYILVKPLLQTPIIVAYFHPGNRTVNAENIDISKIDFLNYAFAVPKNDKLKFAKKNDVENLKKLVELKKSNPKLHLLISVGGWGTETDFSVLAMTPYSRKTFIESMIKFIRLFKIDGIDLDWEYPGLSKNNVANDKQNFTLLIKEIKQALYIASKQDKKYYYLTIAAGAFSSYIANTEINEVSKYIDYIFLMTYDYAGQWNKHTAHHTNLYQSDNPWSMYSASKSVDLYINAGVPVTKLVLGSGFYGRQWKQVERKKNGLYQKAKGIGSIPYRKIKQITDNNPNYKRYWDSVAKAAYYWNQDSAMFISYEDTASLREKANFIKQKNLAGIMYWEYYSDADNFLLNYLVKYTTDSLTKTSNNKSSLLIKTVHETTK